MRVPFVFIFNVSTLSFNPFADLIFCLYFVLTFRVKWWPALNCLHAVGVTAAAVEATNGVGHHG